MSEMAPEALGTQQDALPGLDGADSGPNINPAWNELLGAVPQGLHNLMIPHLQKWDQGVQQRFAQVHSQYEPYKRFLDQKLDPGILDQSYQVYQALERDPQRFIEAVMEHYGLEVEQGLDDEVEDVEDEGELPFDLNSDPNFDRVRSMTEMMAQALIQERQQKEEQEINAQIDSDLQTIKEKFPYLPEDMILQVLYSAAGMNDGPADMEQVTGMLEKYTEQIISQHRNPSAGAPVILGAGGGTPSTATPVSGLKPQDRRSLIVQQLRAAAQQGG